LAAHNALNALTARLSSAVAAATKKLEKKRAIVQQQLIRADSADTDRLHGELLTTYMYLAKYGDASLTVLNYYDNTDLTIQLDAKKSPAQNAQIMFRRYNKKRTAAKMATEQLDNMQSTQEYYQSLDQMIAAATDIDALNDIASEMTDAGLIKQVSTLSPKGAKGATSQPRQFVISGYTVLIGKNNLQNDLLVKKAHSCDIWLHAQKIHGSHAVIVAGRTPPALEIITQVASLVAYFSKAKQTDKVPVDYTQSKYVSKPRNSAPGKVVYTRQKTLWVSPTPPKE
jgi:predicted ribosome quality control (RQC) complex YloA/Tae2 family protein